jgi:hypothetical protein
MRSPWTSLSRPIAIVAVRQSPICNARTQSAETDFVNGLLERRTPDNAAYRNKIRIDSGERRTINVELSGCYRIGWERLCSRLAEINQPANPAAAHD